MRVWALASCGSLLALTACSSNQSVPPVTEGDQPAGEDGSQVDAQSTRKVNASPSLPAPETGAARPLDRLSGATLGRNPSALTQRTLSELPSRQTSELLRARLDRVRAQRSQTLGPVTQTPGVSGVQAEANPGGAPAAQATVASRRVIPTAQQVVTPLPSPGTPILTATLGATPVSPPGNANTPARSPFLEPVEPAGTSALDLTQTSQSAVASRPHRSSNLQHLSGSPGIALDINSPLLTEQGGTVSHGNGAVPGQHRSAGAHSSTANLVAASTSATQPAPSQATSTNRVEAYQRVGQGHQQSLLSAQAQLTPTQANQPRFSGTPLELDRGASSLHGGNGPEARADSLPAARSAPSTGVLSRSAPGTAPSAPIAPQVSSLPPSLPLHEGQQRSSQAVPSLAAASAPIRPDPVSPDIGVPQENSGFPVHSQPSVPPLVTLSAGSTVDLVARVTEHGGSIAPAVAPHGLRDLGFAETIRLQPEALLLSLAERQESGQSADVLKRQTTPVCVNQAVAEDANLDTEAGHGALTTVSTTAAEGGLYPLPLTELPTAPSTSFNKAKVCPTGTKPLAQIIPEAATAGTPIPGRVESPTR